MICPLCRNKGFLPNKEFRNPVINIGPTEQFTTGTVRRYTCLNCGRSFRTQETLLEEVNVNKQQGDLFNVRRQSESVK